MIILTNAPYAYRIFGTSKQSPIGRMDIHMAQQLLDEGHFAEGSMRPKIEAAIQFSGRPKCRTTICNVEPLAQSVPHRPHELRQHFDISDQRGHLDHFTHTAMAAKLAFFYPGTS